jgi:hypothetical protein
VRAIPFCSVFSVVSDGTRSAVERSLAMCGWQLNYFRLLFEAISLSIGIYPEVFLSYLHVSVNNLVEFLYF